MKTIACTLMTAVFCITSAFSQIFTEKRIIQIVGRATTTITADQIVYQVGILTKDPFVEPDTIKAPSADIDCEIDSTSQVSEEFSLAAAKQILADILSKPEIGAELIVQKDYSINPFDFHSDEDNSVLVMLNSLESLQLLIEELQQHPFFIGRIQDLDYSGLEGVQNALKVEAVKNAQETASAMLAVTGFRLGKVVKVVDNRTGEESYGHGWDERAIDLYGRKNSGKMTVVEEVAVAFRIR